MKIEHRNTAMNGCRKSDRPVIPAKLPNDVPVDGTTEAVEERGLTEGNADQQDTHRTQGRSECVPSGLDRIRKAAIRNKEEKFTALLHHVI